MCGITGIFEYQRAHGRVSEDLVGRMRDVLEHRGPDGAGIYISEDRRVGFGHRRLSIIDLAGGAQPMIAPDGTCIVFNGEIYNYPALRRSLDEPFRTDCDTEVILHLYRRYGRQCVDHLVGMFAFAIWDPAEERVFFARDPIGEKPFYWADRGGIFIFGSEIKALLEHPAVGREVNLEALGPYLANLVTPAPDTAFRGIYKLPPGHLGQCDRNGVTISAYRDITGQRGFGEPHEDPAVRVRELLDASVGARLMSDVPVGVLLSGGVDSTAILGLVGEQAHALTSFTVGFPGYEDADEREEARWVARHFGTDHHEILLSEDDALRSLASLIHHQDEPLADPVCVPLDAVCGMAHQHGTKVVLAGEGADELFWGYSGYAGVLKRWARYRALLALPRPLRAVAARSRWSVDSARRREQLEGIETGRPNAIHFPVGLTRAQRCGLLGAPGERPGWAPGTPVSGEDALATLAFDTQEYEFQLRLPELLLMRIDRFSMANSVEARVPFLDPSLVDYVYRLPLRYKVNTGVTKYVLKQAIKDLLPTRVVNRPKQGFAAPTSQWFAGRHGDLLSELMRGDTLRSYFDVGYLARMLKATDAATWDYGQILWPILNFGLWHRYWIEGDSLEGLIDDDALAV